VAVGFKGGAERCRHYCEGRVKGGVYIIESICYISSIYYHIYYYIYYMHYTICTIYIFIYIY
jgi:hypothetical protein